MQLELELELKYQMPQPLIYKITRVWLMFATDIGGEMSLTTSTYQTILF